MSRARGTVLLAIASCLVAAAAGAQVIEEESVDIAFTGRITLVDAIARTIALEGANGERMLVGVNDETTIMSDAKKLTLERLHKGDWLAVDADQRGATVVATYIEVVDDPSDPSDD